MSEKTRRPAPAPGWPVLHLYYHVERQLWSREGTGERKEAVAEFRDWLRGRAREEGLQLIPMAGIGKFDVGFMAVHPDLHRLQELGQEIRATAFGRCLKPAYSFLSLSEASEYVSTPGQWAQQLIDEKHMDPASSEFAASVATFGKRMAQYSEARLHPQLPADMPAVCFYPMRKLRTDTRNWYALDFARRQRLMSGHGETGRRFADRVTQLVTSATGLDNWEWGVTLFARDLSSLRDVVYEMRFDEASAIYAEFGPFYVGLRFAGADLGKVLKL